MKIGKYNVDRWLARYSYTGVSWHRIFSLDEHYAVFDIEICISPEDDHKWILYIGNIEFANIYYSMFPIDNRPKVFGSIDDGKKNIDLFLYKLNKLKIFL